MQEENTYLDLGRGGGAIRPVSPYARVERLSGAAHTKDRRGAGQLVSGGPCYRAETPRVAL